jgi:hypothetical protein
MIMIRLHKVYTISCVIIIKLSLVVATTIEMIRCLNSERPVVIVIGNESMGPIALGNRGLIGLRNRKFAGLAKSSLKRTPSRSRTKELSGLGGPKPHTIAYGVAPDCTYSSPK